MMNPNNILGKIYSIYIRQKPFQYIKDENFLYKLVKFSKNNQNLFSINLLSYKEKSKDILII